MGVGTRGEALEISGATTLRDGLQTRAWRTERVRSGSVRSLGAICFRTRISIRRFTIVGFGKDRQLLDDGRYRSVRTVLGIACRSYARRRYARLAGEQKRSALHRDLEFGFHSVQRQPGRHVYSAAAATRRYRNGFRARDRDHSGHEESHRFLRNGFKLRDRHLSPDLRRDRKTERQEIRVDAAETSELPAKASRKRSTSPSASSPITSARSASRSPTESFHQTKDAVTFCAASCAARFAMVAHSAFTNRSSSNWSTSSRKRWATFSRSPRRSRRRSRKRFRREEESFNKTLDNGMSSFEEAIDSVESATPLSRMIRLCRADYGSCETGTRCIWQTRGRPLRAI